MKGVKRYTPKPTEFEAVKVLPEFKETIETWIKMSGLDFEVKSETDENGIEYIAIVGIKTLSGQVLAFQGEYLILRDGEIWSAKADDFEARYDEI